MKRLFTLLMVFTFTVYAFSQAPEKMSYQAVIRSIGGALVTSQSIGMKISILQGSATGTPVYVETQTATTNVNGLVTLEIGSGTPDTGTFTGINWSAGPYFIKTETDPAGGTTYSITGSSQILSMPYSLYAKTAATSADAVKITGDQSIAGTKTFTGTINADNKVITSVANPVSTTDASNKAYVDALKQRVVDLEDVVNTHLPLPTNGLIAYYPFNGNANDGSGNNLNGTVYGATLTTDRYGNSNNAYYFDGNSSYIKILANSLINIPNFTIAVWVNAEIFSGSGAEAGHIISKGVHPNYNYLLAAGNLNSTNTFNLVTNNNGTRVDFLSTKTFNANTWYFFVVTNDGNTIKLSVNTNLCKVGTTGTALTYNNDIYIGRYESNTLWNFKGKIDDIRIYNRALTESEIKLLYNESGYPNSFVTDNEGNSYRTVKIGTQTWMAENLKATRYQQNGVLIGTTTPATLDVSGEVTPKYQWAYGGNESNVAIYGRLYTWYAATDYRNVCPTGWHVPSDSEWGTLTSYLFENGYGYGENTGAIAKSMASTSGWTANSTAGNVGNNQASNNSSGFTAIPGGYRGDDGSFGFLGGMGYWWTSDETDSFNAWTRTILHDYNAVYDNNYGSRDGISIRCLKDN